MASSFLNAVSMQMLAWKRRVAVEQRQTSPHRRRPAVVFISRYFRLSIQLGLLAFLPVMAWSQGTYTTNFPSTENPISEGGRWINGGNHRIGLVECPYHLGLGIWDPKRRGGI